ncbi:MAG: HAD-IA family hydrolase [bacterium]|nr:HAD-IA family hydrolase [bacterium]
MNEKIEAVLFDFDGTLLNTLPGWMKVIDNKLREIEGSASLIKPLPNTYQDIMRTLAAELMSIKDYGVSHNEALSFVDSVIVGSISEIEKADLHHGMRKLLAEINKKKVKAGIVSSTKTETIVNSLRRLKIDTNFLSVVGRDRVTKTKPDPEPVELCLAELKVAPSKAIMIGDHESDIIAANRAGVKSILFYPEIHEAFYDSQSIESIEAILVKSIEEIIKFLK